MDPIAQQIAIGEACGLTRDSLGPDWDKLPDYLNDLNAMREAEKWLRTKGQTTWEKYGDELQNVAHWYVVGYIGDYPRDLGSLASIAHVSADQRAEAFLKTLGKWT